MRDAASPRCTTTFSCATSEAEELARRRGRTDAVAAWRELVVVAGDQYTFDLAMGACNFRPLRPLARRARGARQGTAKLEQQLVELRAAQ